MIRVDDGAKLKASEGLGVDGKLVDFALVKSRTNAAGRSVPMVFTFDHGFDDLLSLFMYMKSTGAIATKGATCVLTGYEQFKFTQKTFKEKLFSDAEFAACFNQAAKMELEKLLGSNLKVVIDQEQEDKHNSIVDSILSA